MTTIAFDPDEAKVFMQLLSESVENVRESTQALAASKSELHDAFAGNQKYAHYENQVDEMTAQLQRFATKAEDCVVYLGHLIALADEFFENK